MCTDSRRYRNANFFVIIEYHAMLGQFDLLDFAADHDVLITAYSPLAQGEILNNPLLLEIGNKYQKSAAQIALRWLIEQELSSCYSKISYR